MHEILALGRDREVLRVVSLSPGEQEITLTEGTSGTAASTSIVAVAEPPPAPGGIQPVFD